MEQNIAFSLAGMLLAALIVLLVTEGHQDKVLSELALREMNNDKDGSKRRE